MTRSEPPRPDATSTPAPGASAIPPLPENATPEEKDLHWLKYHYQGDQQRQLTFRAVLMGGILGMFMSLSNLYTTVKLSWAFGVAITSCVLSYVIWNAMRALSGGRLSPMSILENNCMQSTASAAGYTTGGTVGTAFGALLLIEGVHQPWYVLTPFVLLSAALGVFLAIPMKRQMINHEQLRFPSGMAAAETLRSLYSHGQEAMQKARSLLMALAVGGVVGLLRTYGMLVEQLKNSGRPQAWLANLQSLLHIPEELAFPAWLNPLARGHMVGFVFEPSVLLIGGGMLIGLRVGLSMLLGAVVLYFVVAPQVLGWDAAHAGLAGYVPSFKLSSEGNFNPTRWALWGGTSVMVFSSLTSLGLQWRTIGRAFSLFKKRQSTAQNDALAAIEVPGWWLAAGLVPIGAGLVATMYFSFHVSIGLGVISVLMSSLVALVCCRATGETDTTPIGPMGKVTQLLYAMLPGAVGNKIINLMSAGLTSAAGAASADLLTDLKSGYLLGANPRRQFLAQFFGVFFGTLAVVPAWYLMFPTKAVLESYNPPATNMWKAVADLLTQGVQMLPRTALWAIAVGSLVGILLPVLEQLFPKARRFMPSAMGLGLSWVITFQNSFSFAIGAIIVEVWTRFRPKNAGIYSVPIASGLVAGESLVAALIAIGCTLVGLAFAG